MSLGLWHLYFKHIICIIFSVTWQPNQGPDIIESQNVLRKNQVLQLSHKEPLYAHKYIYDLKIKTKQGCKIKRGHGFAFKINPTISRQTTPCTMCGLARSTRFSHSQPLATGFHVWLRVSQSVLAHIWPCSASAFKGGLFWVGLPAGQEDFLASAHAKQATSLQHCSHTFTMALQCKCRQEKP